MRFAAKDLLARLLEAEPCSTAQAPRDARGLYGLVDHLGDLRYIGSTHSMELTLYERIHQRHRTGSEGKSHYFSRMYNTGRMWRDPKDALTKADGDMAKVLRNEFILDHCRAVWLPLPDTEDIARLESEVLALAPERAIAWNRCKMPAYDEPVDLVETTLRRLGWGARELAAVERQRLRFHSATAGPVAAPVPTPAAVRQTRVTPFPEGPFRFFALDVETANHDRSSICQIGVACVRPDNSIETWMSYVDPQVNHWVFTTLHGISARTVEGAPTFAEVLPVLVDALSGATVYQHSGFDRSAIAAACGSCSVPIPPWNWRDSVGVARTAWPELRGNGGHGLASLKRHLGLIFDHHDAGEDARAAAEVVLHAERVTSPPPETPQNATRPRGENRANPSTPAECNDVITSTVSGPFPTSCDNPSHEHSGSHIGTTEITQGNLDNNHIYLRNFFEKFPSDAVGGSNRASAALREIAVDWGGGAVVMTDLDCKKQFFRKRAWVRDFFELHGIRAGDKVMIEQIAPYSYRIAPQRRP